MVSREQQPVSLIEAAVAPPPELVARLEVLERQGADHVRMIEHLQVRVAELEAGPAADEDGQPRSSGRWCKTAETMRLTGHSRSGLRKLRQQNRIVFDFSGPHCLYDVTNIVRKKVRKVPA
jgi:hypothetical protein